MVTSPLVLNPESAFVFFNEGEESHWKHNSVGNSKYLIPI